MWHYTCRGRVVVNYAPCGWVLFALIMSLLLLSVAYVSPLAVSQFSPGVLVLALGVRYCLHEVRNSIWRLPHGGRVYVFCSRTASSRIACGIIDNMRPLLIVLMGSLCPTRHFLQQC